MSGVAVVVRPVGVVAVALLEFLETQLPLAQVLCVNEKHDAARLVVAGEGRLPGVHTSTPLARGSDASPSAL